MVGCENMLVIMGHDNLSGISCTDFFSADYNRNIVAVFGQLTQGFFNCAFSGLPGAYDKIGSFIGFGVDITALFIRFMIPP